MRNVRMILLAGAALSAQPAFAADALKFGAAPPWVVPQTIPDPPSKASDAPVAVLLSDSQSRLEPGKITSFIELAVKVQTPDGLSAGNLSLPWQPATDTVTINKLHIIRDGKVIDVLAGGQKFTVMRRETNLDAATLDGTLTANMQAEGLQVGDIIDLATTDEHVDPVLKNHVESPFGDWNGIPVDFGHVRLSWPSTLRLSLQQSDSLPQGQRSKSNGFDTFEMSQHLIEPLLLPKSAPMRFQLGRFGEATDFRSWSDVSDLMAPLYKQAAVIPTSGPLRDELETIRKSARSPKERAEKALQLVEDRVRYVALEMGTGGYVPAAADTTWSRRFGDCKGKSALLLALLHELGIEAEPVLVHHSLGDILPERLPMVAYFDHVIVRAHISGKTYWLDGTRIGDADLDRIPVPDFEWGLPLVDHAALVAIAPPPRTVPDNDSKLTIDATAGVFAPAPTTAMVIVRGDAALGMKFLLAKLTPSQEQDRLRQYWTRQFDFFEPATTTAVFDEPSGELRLGATGVSKIDWSDGWFHVPGSSLGYDPDFNRAAGPFHDAPFATNYPNYDRNVVSIRLPKGFLSDQKNPPRPVQETLVGVEYHQSTTVSGDTMTIESSDRTVVPEVPYKTALADEPRLKALGNEDVSLTIPGDYQATDKDLAELQTEKPSTALSYFQRANAYLVHEKQDEALSDLNAGLALDPKNSWGLAKRAWVHVLKNDTAEAEKDLAAAQAIDPNDITALFTRGYMAEQNGDLTTALKYFSKVLELDPHNKSALLQRGHVFSDKGRKIEAMQDLDAAVSADPEDVEALVARAYAELGTSDVGAAENDVHAALAVDPSNKKALDASATIAIAHGNYRSAVDAYSNMISADSPDRTSEELGRLLAARAEAYRELAEYDKALADTDAALKTGYKKPPLRLSRANIFFAQGNRDAVANEADLLLKENPKSNFAFVAAGKMYAAIGRRADAVKALEGAIALAPAPYVYLNLADVRPFSDYAARLSDIQNALQLDPSNADALQAKADVLREEGRYSDAVAVYDQAIKSAPAFDYLLLGKAVALSEAGQISDAEKIFAAQDAKAKTPGDYGSICDAEARAGILLEQALKDCRTKARLSPSSGTFTLGMVFLRLGKIDDAISAFSNEIVKDASSSSSYFARAIAYARKGDDARARADRAEALKIDPEIEDRLAEYGMKSGAQSATVTGKSQPSATKSKM